MEETKGFTFGYPGSGKSFHAKPQTIEETMLQCADREDLVNNFVVVDENGMHGVEGNARHMGLPKMTFKDAINGGVDYYGIRVANWRPNYSITIFKGIGEDKKMVVSHGKITADGIFTVDDTPCTDFDGDELLKWSAVEWHIFFYLK
jgi:hypothetical protein